MCEPDPELPQPPLPKRRHLEVACPYPSLGWGGSPANGSGWQDKLPSRASCSAFLKKPRATSLQHKALNTGRAEGERKRLKRVKKKKKNIPSGKTQSTTYSTSFLTPLFIAQLKHLFLHFYHLSSCWGGRSPRRRCRPTTAQPRPRGAGKRGQQTQQAAHQQLLLRLA